MPGKIFSLIKKLEETLFFLSFFSASLPLSMPCSLPHHVLLNATVKEGDARCFCSHLVVMREKLKNPSDVPTLQLYIS